MLCIRHEVSTRNKFNHIIFPGTLYTGLADGRIVKLEGDKVIDVVRTGKPPCGKILLSNLTFGQANVNADVFQCLTGYSVEDLICIEKCIGNF